MIRRLATIAAFLFASLFVLIFVSTTIAQVTGAQNLLNRNRDKNNRQKNVKALLEPVVESGFVFIDGKYVAPPYQIDYNESQIIINAVSFDQALFDSFVEKKRRLDGREVRRQARQLRKLLEIESSVVLFSGKAVQVVHSVDLLGVLVDDEARAAFSRDDGNRIAPDAADPQVWEAFVRNFECPPELRERANKYFDRVKEIQEKNSSLASANLAQESARRLVESSAYPLTAIGMLLVAVAFGHLLSFKPSSSADSGISSEAQRAVVFSLTLLAAMSALDLTWTILASRTGDMKELNPIGAALISDPISLILLKVVATLVAVALLFVLRHHSSAQKGAWWACLVCTLLTARWLTFNSLFT